MPAKQGGNSERKHLVEACHNDIFDMRVKVRREILIPCQKYKSTSSSAVIPSFVRFAVTDGLHAYQHDVILNILVPLRPMFCVLKYDDEILHSVLHGNMVSMGLFAREGSKVSVKPLQIAHLQIRRTAKYQS